MNHNRKSTVDHFILKNRSTQVWWDYTYIYKVANKSERILKRKKSNKFNTYNVFILITINKIINNF